MLGEFFLLAMTLILCKQSRRGRFGNQAFLSLYGGLYLDSFRKKLEDIFGMSLDPAYGHGLILIRRFIPYGRADHNILLQKAFDGVVFGMLSPMPHEFLTYFWSGPDTCLIEEL
jgi:hypothetical protein